MGALHAGPPVAASRAARAECSTVVMSLFVNPTQFGDDGRPRRAIRATRPRDLAAAAEAGVDLVFAPGGRGDVPARLPDVGRRGRARLDPRGELPAGPFPRSRDGLPQALHDRPPRPRLLRPEGRAAGRGPAAHDRPTSRSISSCAPSRPSATTTASPSPPGTSCSRRPSASARLRCRGRSRRATPSARASCSTGSTSTTSRSRRFDPPVLAAAVRVGSTRLIDNVP